VTRIYPDPDFLAGFGDRIHAFLPAMPRIEFGAVTPKHDHLTVNIAGAQVDARLMGDFLTFAPVKRVLPPSFNPSSSDLAYFKGRFPVSLARGYYNDRYVMAGDAAGLLRPFKGKGVTYGCLTGIRAAETIMKEGISKAAFRAYERKSQEVLDDMVYGSIVRWLAIASAYYGFLDPVLEMAKNDHALRRALFDAVSANKLFKEIVWDTLRPGLAARLAAASALALLGFKPRSS
jgi:flavin-dependent dehydrogenase